MREEFIDFQMCLTGWKFISKRILLEALGGISGRCIITKQMKNWAKHLKTVQEIKCNYNALLGLVVTIISHNNVNAEF